MKPFGGYQGRSEPGQKGQGFYGAMGRLGEKPLVFQMAFFVTVAVAIAADEQLQKIGRWLGGRRR